MSRISLRVYLILLWYFCLTPKYTKKLNCISRSEMVKKFKGLKVLYHFLLHKACNKIFLIFLKCASVCPSVCLSVCYCESEIIFYSVVGSQPNLQSQLNSLQVIFRLETWILRPSVSGSDTK